jgi:hypothetical protein
MALFKRKRSVRTEDVVIDLREPANQSGELVWGMPSRCPECGGFGYLDIVDVERQVMHQHCPTCWAKWQITAEQIEAQNAPQNAAG